MFSRPPAKSHDGEAHSETREQQLVTWPYQLAPWNAAPPNLFLQLRKNNTACPAPATFPNSWLLVPILYQHQRTCLSSASLGETLWLHLKFLSLFNLVIFVLIVPKLKEERKFLLLVYSPSKKLPSIVFFLCKFLYCYSFLFSKEFWHCPENFKEFCPSNPTTYHSALKQRIWFSV